MPRPPHDTVVASSLRTGCVPDVLFLADKAPAGLAPDVSLSHVPPAPPVSLSLAPACCSAQSWLSFCVSVSPPVAPLFPLQACPYCLLLLVGPSLHHVPACLFPCPSHFLASNCVGLCEVIPSCFLICLILQESNYTRRGSSESYCLHP